MKPFLVGLALAVLASGAAPAHAAPADGEIVSSAPCERHTQAYEAYVAGQVKAYRDEADLGRRLGFPGSSRLAEDLPKVLMTPAELDGSQSRPSACRHLYYGSDGLKVAAYVWEPPAIAPGRRLPVILMLHGGNGSGYTADAQAGMWLWTQAGFLVIGVQYRGIDDGEGADQYGGDDVHDVLNAIALARRLPEADMRNVFIYATSRGATDAMLALEQHPPVNAAVLVSPLTDLALEARRRPLIETNVWRRLIPGYDAHRDEILEQRSGVRIARQADLPPLLLMHGTADWRADPKNTLEVADALKARGRPFELRLFKDDVHGLQWNWRERNRLAMAWFRRHMRR